MSKSVWSGYISFGLVAIPINLFPAEVKKELHFHLLDARDHSRVRYERVNENTGKAVSWNDVVKAFEFEKDNYVIMDEKEFQKAAPKAYKSIDIEEFVDLKEIDYLYFEKPYYILPNSENKKAYVLLREALKKTGKAGVAKMVLREKEYLSLIYPDEQALILYLIRYKQEIRNEREFQFPGSNLKEYKIVDREIKMATDLIKEMNAAWKPEKYHDESHDILMKWIENKAKGKSGARKIHTVETRQDDVIDFISLLKKSVKKKEDEKQKPDTKLKKSVKR